MDEQRDRRKEPRIACHLEATCETIEGTPPTVIHSPGIVTTLSYFGAGLTVSRQFQEGSMLFLKLPDPNRVFWCGRSARVAHAKALFTNLLLGCEFTAPLTDDEFHILLGHKPAPDRRMKPRFVPSPEVLEHLVVKPVGHDVLVTLRDISVGGICLLVDKPFAAENPLQVQLTNTVTQARCVVSLRSVHARPVGKKWTLGGAFAETLANQELLSLLS
ncbi:MAG TPA: PilZ domain-containing protein [Gemmataceae bacterium]|nr:PilZ domain-containing protein [Gemmataceae bacterium]